MKTSTVVIVGESICQNLHEWEKQARRWTVGASDNFHFFVSNFHRFNFLSGLQYAFAFTHYYAFILGIMCLIPLPSIIFSFSGVDSGQSQQLHQRFGVTEGVADAVTKWMPIASLSFQYAIFGCMFLADAVAVRYLLDFVVKERVGFARNVCHWLCSWPVVLAYNLVTYCAMWRAVLSRGGRFGNRTVKDSLHLSKDMRK